MTEALNKHPELTDLVISVEDLKKNFLFGISFKDDDGNEMADSMFEFYIRSAQEWLQREIGGLLLLPKKIVDEAHDYYLHDLLSYGFMKLNYMPVQRVTRYRMQFPLTDDSIEFDPKWFKVDQPGRSISLIPNKGSIERFLSSQGIGGFLAYYGGDDYVPMTVLIDYEAGFEDRKVPADLLELVAMQASLGTLNIAGDLLGGAGIASKSLSVDGLSESISTTSSPSFAGYGARIIQYQKQIDHRLPTVRNSYLGIQMVIA